jgi:hypothetical protein
MMAEQVKPEPIWILPLHHNGHRVILDRVGWIADAVNQDVADAIVFAVNTAADAARAERKAIVARLHNMVGDCDGWAASEILAKLRHIADNIDTGESKTP